MLRRWIGDWVQKNAKTLGLVDRGSILLVVYNAFSGAVTAGMWSKVSAFDLARIVLICLVLLALTLGLMIWIARARGFSKEDEIARKITETKRKADGEAYAATESVAEYLAGDLGLKDATPTGYTRATANESEPTPTDIKQFTDMLEAGKVGLLVVNIQEETELTGKIVTAAKSSNIPIVELTEQMPEQYDSLTDWMAALVDAFSQAI